MKTRAYDALGNIAIAKFGKGTSKSAKKKFAEKIMKSNKAIRTVLEKTGKFRGRLRKQETKWIAGEKTKEALYRENSCVFRFNVDKTYFSPRLSNERKEIANLINKKNAGILVMFSGAGPYPIVIAKHNGDRHVYSNEINREANKYAGMNIEMNKLKGRVIMLNGNIQDVATKIKRGLKINNESVPKKFDCIVMPRPQLKDSFLKEAFSLSKKGTMIFYYDFCREDEKDKIISKIKAEAAKNKKRIKILRIKSAGEIAPYKIRARVDFKVLN
jgi:tRNA (guanine37-N1)-methyltransferase